MRYFAADARDGARERDANAQKAVTLSVLSYAGLEESLKKLRVGFIRTGPQRAPKLGDSGVGGAARCGSAAGAGGHDVQLSRIWMDVNALAAGASRGGAFACCIAIPSDSRRVPQRHRQLYALNEVPMKRSTPIYLRA